MFVNFRRIKLIYLNFRMLSTQNTFQKALKLENIHLMHRIYNESGRGARGRVLLNQFPLFLYFTHFHYCQNTGQLLRWGLGPPFSRPYVQMSSGTRREYNSHFHFIHFRGVFCPGLTTLITKHNTQHIISFLVYLRQISQRRGT